LKPDVARAGQAPEGLPATRPLLGALALLFVVAWLSPPLRFLHGIELMPLWLHTLMEFSAIAIAAMIFAIIWNAYASERAGNLLILACAFLATGLLDFAHTLSYRGMPDFVTPAGVEKAINFWLAARLSLALALLVAALRPWRPFASPWTARWLLAATLALTAMIWWLGLFHPEAWPRTFVQGDGLTPFKVGAEYFIVTLMALAALALRYGPHKNPALLLAAGTTILSELSFTLYADAADLMNLLGHLYKTIAYYFFYRAVFVQTVREPFLRVRGEIAERHAAERALADSVRYQEELLAQLPAAVVVHDADGAVSYCNGEAMRLLGMDSETIRGKASDAVGWRFLNEDGTPMEIAGYPVNQVLANRASVHGLVGGIVHGDDAPAIWVQVNAFPYFDAEGRIKHVVTTFIDITALRNARLSLQGTLAELDDLYNHAPCGYHSLDTEGRLVRINQTELDWLGYPRDEVIGRPFTDFLTPASLDVFHASYPRFKASGRADNLEYELRRRDGSTFLVSLSSTALYDKNGNYLASRSTLHDITARKRAEDELRATRDRLEQIIDVSPAAIYRVDLSAADRPARVSFLSHQIVDLTGHALADWQTPGFWESHLHPDDRQAVLDAQGKLFAHDALQHEYRFLCRDGRAIWIHDRLILLRDAAGQPREVIGTWLDITQRKEAELALRQVNEQLEQRVRQRTHELEIINKELEAFSYSVSHDLRAPLRSIDGFSQVLLQRYADKLDDAGRDYLGRVRRASQRMGELIDDLLQLSRLSRGPLRRQEVDLSVLATTLLEELQRTAPERPVRATVQPGLRAYGDPGLLRVMLDNLLGNAWKFTRHTENAAIEFGRETRDGELVYCVRDNGAGFDNAYAHKLFRVFQRLHGNDEYEGTGIGLATVGRIVQRHHGRVWAAGEPGKGATFHFTLPQRGAERDEDVTDMNMEERND